MFSSLADDGTIPPSNGDELSGGTAPPAADEGGGEGGFATHLSSFFSVPVFLGGGGDASETEPRADDDASAPSDDPTPPASPAASQDPPPPPPAPLLSPRLPSGRAEPMHVVAFTAVFPDGTAAAGAADHAQAHPPHGPPRAHLHGGLGAASMLGLSAAEHAFLTREWSRDAAAPATLLDMTWAERVSALEAGAPLIEVTPAYASANLWERVVLRPSARLKTRQGGLHYFEWGDAPTERLLLSSVKRVTIGPTHESIRFAHAAPEMPHRAASEWHYFSLWADGRTLAFGVPLAPAAASGGGGDDDENAAAAASRSLLLWATTLQASSSCEPSRSRRVLRCFSVTVTRPTRPPPPGGVNGAGGPARTCKDLRVRGLYISLHHHPQNVRVCVWIASPQRLCALHDAENLSGMRSVLATCQRDFQRLAAAPGAAAPAADGAPFLLCPVLCVV